MSACTRAVSLAGTVVRWRSSGLDDDPWAQVLEAAPAADPASATIECEIELGDGRPEVASWTPWLYHGRVQCFRGARGVLVADGELALEVSADGARVRGTARPRGARTLPIAPTLRVALLVALRAQGIFDLHAAGLVTPTGRGLLLVGESGAGKSTTAIALGRAGFEVLSDDSMLLRDDDEGTRVFAFPRELHVGRDVAQALGVGAIARDDPALTREKRVIDPAALAGVRFRTAARVDALFFPRVAGHDETVARPLAKAEAFGHLLLGSPVLVADDEPQRARRLQRLATLAAVPTFELLLGRDVLGAPSRVAAKLERILGE